MHALSDALALWPAHAGHTFVHIGAGAGKVLATYAPLRPGHLLLVEGDPRHGEALRNASGSWANTEVLVRAVSAHGSTLNWQRFNLPALDGPLDSLALRTYYPRLRSLETFPQATVALGTLLDQAAEPGEARRADPELRILVMDVAGQEDTLLSSLRPEQLDRFDAVVLCGCTVPCGPGAAAAPQAVQRLQAGGAQLVWSNAERESLWPISVLSTRLGAAGHAAGAQATAEELRRRCDEQAAEISSLRERLAAQAKPPAPPMPPTSTVSQRELEQENAALRQQLRALLAATERAAAAPVIRTDEVRLQALQKQLTDAEEQIALLKDLLLQEPPL